jgi:hypothetical protein
MTPGGMYHIKESTQGVHLTLQPRFDLLFMPQWGGLQSLNMIVTPVGITIIRARMQTFKVGINPEHYDRE